MIARLLVVVVTLCSANAVMGQENSEASHQSFLEAVSKPWKLVFSEIGESVELAGERSLPCQGREKFC